MKKFYFFHTLSQKFIQIDDEMTFGRKKGNCLFYKDTKMSSTHCRVQIVANKAFLTDLNSKNGVKINGKKIPANQKIPLAEKDLIEFGKQQFYLTHRSKDVSMIVKPHDADDFIEP